MKRLIAISMALAGAVVSVAAVGVTFTGIEQSADRTVKVTYTLADAPAIVSFGVETNSASGWASVGGENLRLVSGDVFKRVGVTTGEFRWTPDRGEFTEAIAAGEARVVVSVFALDDPPDYFVFSLVAGTASADERMRFYPSADYLPGGLLGNPDYRTTRLVMRRIHAKCIPWMMGTSKLEPGIVDARETSHPACLDSDYYIAVFPTTHAQGSAMYGASMGGPFRIDRSMRIRDQIWYSSSYASTARNANWPDSPAADSLLGKLRMMSGGMIAFDLPTEAQWEFAARGGYGAGYWGNGKPMLMTSVNVTTDGNLDGYGRYRYNQGSDWTAGVPANYSAYASEQGVTNGAPVAGSYKPNGYGLYDMAGGVWEWCLDWYANDISALNGAVNISATDGTKLAEGTTAGVNRVLRGGSWADSSNQARPGYRSYSGPGYAGDFSNSGMRIACPAAFE